MSLLAKPTQISKPLMERDATPVKFSAHKEQGSAQELIKLQLDTIDRICKSLKKKHMVVPSRSEH